MGDTDLIKIETDIIEFAKERDDNKGIMTKIEGRKLIIEFTKTSYCFHYITEVAHRIPYGTSSWYFIEGDKIILEII